jgi:hypothetical protein
MDSRLRGNDRKRGLKFAKGPQKTKGRGAKPRNGFPLEFIPHSMRGGNDNKGISPNPTSPSPNLLTYPDGGDH